MQPVIYFIRIIAKPIRKLISRFKGGQFTTADAPEGDKLQPQLKQNSPPPLIGPQWRLMLVLGAVFVVEARFPPCVASSWFSRTVVIESSSSRMYVLRTNRARGTQGRGRGEGEDARARTEAEVPTSARDRINTATNGNQTPAWPIALR